jgi:hypothetical protein
MVKRRVACIAFLVVSCLAHGQETAPPSIYLPNQEIRATVSVRTAASNDPAAVLVAALEAIFHDPAVCCGKNSALEDTVLALDSRSLEGIAAKLRGRHLLSDGRPIVVTAKYASADSMNSGQIVTSLTNNRALLLVWNSNFYVLYGALFNETRTYDASQRDFAIHKLLLLDPRFSDARRETVFDREHDDLKKIDGLLTLAVTPQ